MMSNSTQIRKNFMPWFICIIASLFFLYEFIQINMFNTIATEVIRTYHLNATQFGFLSSIYFYSTVLFLLPAGQILDRYSPKIIILITLGICITGIFIFSITHNLIIAGVSRFFEGIGSAFCFLGSFKIAANWLSKAKLSLATGVISTIGMLGGVIAQTPLTLLVEKYGWRQALSYDSLLGVTLFLLIYLIVQDGPAYNKAITQSSKIIFSQMKEVYLCRHNWFCGLYTCFLNVPMALLGALWGNLYLKQIHHFSDQQSSVIVSMLFIGTIIGAPLVGVLSGIGAYRKFLMFIAPLLTFLILLSIIYLNDMSYHQMITIFLLLGIFSSTQILGYPTASEMHPKRLSAMSASVVSFTTMCGYIVFQPLFGFLMDLGNHFKFIHGLRYYTGQDFIHALLLIPVMAILSGVLVFYMQHSKKSEYEI
jgi:MFS family permease